MKLRRLITLVEETRREMGRDIAPPARRALAAAVIENPFAGRYADDLSELIDTGAELGDLLGRQALGALGCEAGDVQGYGKAALVGEAGELEHAAALLHPKLGAPLREVLGGGKALVPSSKAMGGPGGVIDVPLGHKDAAYVRSHFDGMEVGVPDGPKANELLFALAMSRGARIHARMGGLAVDDVQGVDGLR